MNNQLSLPGGYREVPWPYAIPLQTLPWLASNFIRYCNVAHKYNRPYVTFLQFCEQEIEDYPEYYSVGEDWTTMKYPLHEYHHED